ncbi:MAG: ZmpA/ZmpB/ZmpC family metallo-endopeptidase, partial [Gemella haemolysans]|nr:ZmpA/ZmpB/ZmpC family metallo-endopeptidase [Gemella haemolysans]
MKKENFKRKQYFSIRKYKMGACSVLLGTSLFLSLNYTDEVKASEVREVTTHAVDKDSLSEQIKKQLKVFEENKIEVEEGKEYYFVYKKNNLLPNTGDIPTGTLALGGALLLVCLTLIKKKKGKLIFLVSMLTVSGNLSQVMAFEDFKELQSVVIKTSIGGMLPSPEEIPGYSFTGYYFEIGKTYTNKSSSIKIEEQGEFTPGVVEKKTGVEEKVVVSEKGKPLVQPENPEAVISEKGEALVQPENSEAVVSEKGEPLVQPENPEAVISEKGEPLVQPENPKLEIKPTPEQPTPDGKLAPEKETKPPIPNVKPNPVEPVIPDKPVVEPKQPGTAPKIIEGKDGKTPDVITTPKKPSADKVTEGELVIPPSITIEKELDYKTIYKASPDLRYNEQQEETLGEKGKEVTTTSYTLDKSTGKIVENVSTKIEKQPVNKIVKIGNVEKVVKPIAITESRKDAPEILKGKEVVEDTGEQGETTITKTYEVNPETGELTNPTEKTEITKAMRPKVILVGTKEDKPHVLRVNNELENAVNVTEATAEMKNVDLLTNEKLKTQLTPSDLEITRDLFLKRKELQKTNPAITDAEVKEVLRKEYLEKLSIKETLEETKKDLESNLKKVAAHTLSIIGDTPQNREKVKRDIEDNKEKILLGLSYINRFYNIDFGDTNIRDILAYNPSSFG